MNMSHFKSTQWYSRSIVFKSKPMKIFWTQKALSQHKDLEEYLLSNWSRKSVDRYVIKLRDTIDLIKKFPESGIMMDNGYRRMNVTSQTALIYKVVNTEMIVIMMVWDNRRKPIW